MGKVVTLTEEQLRNLVENSIKEAVNEVNWFQRAGQGIRNAYDNVKTGVGSAVAGAKAGLKYGGAINAKQGANQYRADRNTQLAASRKEEADAAVAEFRKEYGRKVGELNRWKANEIRQIKQMYGADAFAKKAVNAQNNVSAAMQDKATWNGYDLNNVASNTNSDKAVAEESISKIVGEVLKEHLSK